MKKEQTKTERKFETYRNSRYNKKDIISVLKANGYEDKLLSYDGIRELYRIYGAGLKEMEFVQTILGVSYQCYAKAKSRGSRTRVLKKGPIGEEEIKRIKNELIEQRYVGKSITYSELKELYKKYEGEVSKAEFAQKILGISKGTYNVFKKNRGDRVRILKGDKISEEEKEQIKQQIKDRMPIGKLITYEELQELHREYGKGMTEPIFARNILGIVSANYKHCKRGKRTPIFKGETISEEEKERIVKEVKSQHDSGKAITYEEFKEIYDKYKTKILEKDFVQNILNVNYESFKKYKYSGAPFKILKEKRTTKNKNVSSSKQVHNNPAEQCISLLSEYTKLGYNKKQAIMNTAKRMDIDSNKMLEYMTEYVLKRELIAEKKDKIKLEER